MSNAGPHQPMAARFSTAMYIMYIFLELKKPPHWVNIWPFQAIKVLRVACLKGN